MLTTRAGVSSAEVLIGIVVSGILLAALLSFHARVVRDIARALSRADEHRNLSAAREFISVEVRAALGPAPPFSATADGHEFRYRVARWAGTLCAWPSRLAADTHQLQVRVPLLGRWRGPRPGSDSVLVWREIVATPSGDDGWIQGAVWSQRSEPCPSGEPGMMLRIASPGPMTRGVQVNAPVVGFERAALRLYRGGDGRGWLGRASASFAGFESVQPAFGPFDLDSSTMTVDTLGMAAVRLISSSGATVRFRVARRSWP